MLALALSLASCSDGEDRSPRTSTSPPGTESAAESADAPLVSILEPTRDSRVPPRFTVRVQVDSFELAPDEIGRQARDGEGHLHFSLDGGTFDKPPHSSQGAFAQQLGVAGRYSPAADDSVSYRDIPSGEHTVEVMLAENDHEPVEGASAKVTFEVSAEAGLPARALN